MELKTNKKAEIGISCVDTKYYTESVHAIRRTIDTLKDVVDIKKIYWFSDIPFPETIQIPVFWYKIKKFDSTWNDVYSHLCVKVMPKICTEDYNLIVQYDGFAVNSEAWTDEFLQYDYIGACWIDNTVGNGGFSLRSRKLYDAFIEMDAKYKTEDYPDKYNTPFFTVFNGHSTVIPEDVLICKILRAKLYQFHNIRFAPMELAHRFSIENHKNNDWVGRSLGFHGKIMYEKYKENL